ncbi:MAG: tetratricopeptide repeat protein [Candidatus Aminicenantaceae bacterium]
MRKINIVLLITFMALSLGQSYIEAQSDYDLFTEAKVLIFDKKWTKAQKILDELLEKHPDSRFYAQALFYKGKCLEEQGGKDADALAVFKRFLRQEDADQSLTEDAENTIVDLAIRLYTNGRRSYLTEAEKRLKSEHRDVRYYAAIQLSFVEEQRTREMALPALKDILDESRDEELCDRAKLAILRIDPDAFEEYGEAREEQEERGARILYFRIYKQGQRKPALKLNIPWALADLAFSAISQEDKVRLRKEGYDLDRMIRQLLSMKGEVLEIYSEEDGVTFQMWIK